MNKFLIICFSLFMPPFYALHRINLNGPDIKQDERGNTDLHIAVKKQDDRLVESLVQAKADITITNNDKLSPLDLARDLVYWSDADDICEDDHLNSIDIYLYLFKNKFYIWQNSFEISSTCCEDGDIEISECCEDCEYCEENGK